MRIVDLVDGPGRVIDRFGSVGAVRLGGVGFRGDGGWTLLSLGAGSHLGRHPTALHQLFVVMEGSGWVAGDDGKHVPIEAGQAALWHSGEEHESGSDTGMRAAVLEAAEIYV